MPADNNMYSASLASEYDRTAEEYDWRGPEVAFGLSYVFVNPGESILDIGIGTGLSSVLFHKAGLTVYGMDLSPAMLEVCRAKGFARDLKLHDLTRVPYPYDTGSLDHALCLGVFSQFADLRPVFSEVARILRNNGMFAFMVADRSSEEEPAFAADPEHTQSDQTVTVYRHSKEEISAILNDHDFVLLRSLEFPVPMNPERTSMLRAIVYVAARR